MSGGEDKKGDIETQVLDNLAAGFPGCEGDDTDDINDTDDLWTPDTDDLERISSEPLLLSSERMRHAIEQALERGAQFWTPSGRRLRTLEEIADAFEVTGRLLAAKPTRRL